MPILRNQHLTRDQHLEYLACIARSLPEQWVPVEPLPYQSRPPSRPTGAQAPPLWNEPSEYAKKLLTAYRHDYFETFWLGKQRPNTLATRYSVYPKAKVGADDHLRYLTLSTWLYQRDRQLVSLEAIGNMAICPHLGFAPYHEPLGYFLPNHYRNKYEPPDQLAAAIKAALAQKDDNSTAVTEVCGACPRCPTDFAVQGSPDCVVLRVWRDLGPEGSPASLAWRVQVSDFRPSYLNSVPVGLTLDHEPGSIRALYNGAGECLEPPLITKTQGKKG